MQAWALHNGFIIQHIDNKTKFEEKILSTSFLFLHSLVNMLKFTSIVGYTSCGPTYIESFLTIFGQCINVLNYNLCYLLMPLVEFSRHLHVAEMRTGIHHYKKVMQQRRCLFHVTTLKHNVCKLIALSSSSWGKTKIFSRVNHLYCFIQFTELDAHFDWSLPIICWSIDTPMMSWRICQTQCYHHRMRLYKKLLLLQILT